MKTPTARSGEKPTNQRSLASLVVPVLPASGLPTALIDDAGAALDHAFHDRGDLIGGERVEHLLALVDQLRLVLVRPISAASQPSQSRSSWR